MITLLLVLALQDEADVARTRVALEYYATWNGDFPGKLDDLVTKPQAIKVWPDGGFLEKVPKLAYADGKLAGKELITRTENIDGIPIVELTTRLRLAEAIAAVRAVRAKSGKWPASLADIGGPTRDGWGNDLAYVTNDTAARISSPGRQLAAAVGPTDEVRKKVAKLVGDLAADWIQDRDAAAKELDAMGASILPLLEEALKAATENGAKIRLEKLITARHDEERAASKGVDLTVFTFTATSGNERAATASLKTIATAQADYRSNDRDNDRAQNFWAGDVRSLYWMCPSMEGTKPCQKPSEEQAIKLIEPSLAEADAAPLNLIDLAKKPSSFPTPKSGYLFRTVRSYRTNKIVPYSSGKDFVSTNKNFGKFAIVAFPADYGVTGTKTYFMDETITIFEKDTGGDPFLVAPAAPGAEGWKKID